MHHDRLGGFVPRGLGRSRGFVSGRAFPVGAAFDVSMRFALMLGMAAVMGWVILVICGRRGQVSGREVSEFANE